MLFPFYNNDSKAYTIDDANFDCWRIIVAECDWNHKYATLCELIQDCPSVKQLTNPCVVSFLNNPKAYSNWLPQEKWFVKVNNNWCLELADPCICNNDWDKYVIATEDDNNPWPLDTKVKWSCSYDWLYCIDIEEAWPQTLVWRPSWPNWPFINPSLPTDECKDGQWYIVKLKSNWAKWYVDFDCPEEDNKPQYCKCVWQVWRASTSCKDRTVRYFLPRANSAFKPIDTMVDDAQSYIAWDWVCKWTDAFAAPKTYWVITIEKAWIYEIAFSTYITFSQTLHSIRCWLYYDNWSWPTELNDIKYQTWEYRVDWNPEVFNRCWPEEWNKEKFIENWVWRYKWAWRTMENTWLPFARTYVLNITESTEIFMAVKPDMRWVDPRLILENDYDERYYIQVEWQWSSAYWAVTTIDIARIWNSVHQSRMQPI